MFAFPSAVMLSEDSRSPESDLLSTDAAKAAKYVEQVRYEFRESWGLDAKFLEKFFPIRPAWKPHIEATQKQHYNARASRWKTVPKIPKAASKLYTPLRMLMNGVLLAEEQSRRRPSVSDKSLGHKPVTRTSAYLHELVWDKTHVRRVLATHTKKKKLQSGWARHGHSPVSPPLFLAGAGGKVLGVTWTFIKPIAQAGISPIEVILDSEDSLAARDRLAASMTQVMSNQTHRRFAYGLIMTETTCTVYMFDHSGAVASPPFNYHQHPAQFCAVIFGLGSDRGELVGFDQSMFPGTKGFRVRTLVNSGENSSKEVQYVIREGLFRFSSLVGRGTTILRTLKLDDLNSTFVVKDAWIPRGELAGRESEGSLLRHAQAEGVVHGVAQVEHFEEIRRSDDPNDLDTILRNRRIDQPTAEDLKLERVHTRIVLKPFAETIDQFETRKDLLFAFHDAVLGVCLQTLFSFSLSFMHISSASTAS
jgi:Fungal protein kinase